jgi:hypothetical protein
MPKVYPIGHDVYAQCPNCGGYRVIRLEGPTFRNHLLLGLLLLGIGIVVTIPVYVISKILTGGNQWHKYGHHCRICGHFWLRLPEESPQITTRPELIRAGEQLLREEEEEEERRRRRSMRH